MDYKLILIATWMFFFLNGYLQDKKNNANFITYWIKNLSNSKGGILPQKSNLCPVLSGFQWNVCVLPMFRYL